MAFPNPSLKQSTRVRLRRARAQSYRRDLAISPRCNRAAKIGADTIRDRARRTDVLWPNAARTLHHRRKHIPSLYDFHFRCLYRGVAAQDHRVHTRIFYRRLRRLRAISTICLMDAEHRLRNIRSTPTHIHTILPNSKGNIAAMKIAGAVRYSPNTQRSGAIYIFCL